MVRGKKIESISIVDQVCVAIKDMISHTPYHPGDRLPSEQEIAETYGVNKLSVRMALQKLSTLGVIEKRNGEGSFVKEFSISPLLIEIVDFINSDEQMSDIQELRQLLEGDSAAKAAVNATEEDKAELRALVREYNNRMDILLSSYSQETFLEMIRADSAFHRKIVSMSRNRLYIDIYTLVSRLVEKHISRLIIARKDALKNIARNQDIHNMLCDAICAGDGRKAREIACKIVDSQEIIET